MGGVGGWIMQDFRNLKVWQKAHSWVLGVYEATAGFPKTEVFGLTSQLRRSAISVASNIAEGCGRGSDSDFGRFLQMAFGSANEADYQLLLAKDLGYLPAANHEKLESDMAEIKRMLAALLRKIQS